MGDMISHTQACMPPPQPRPGLLLRPAMVVREIEGFFFANFHQTPLTFRLFTFLFICNAWTYIQVWSRSVLEDGIALHDSSFFPLASIQVI